MKRIRRQVALAICGLMTAAQVGAAAEATSEIFVGSAVQIAPSTSGSFRLTTFAMRSIQPARYVGTITALESSALADTGATWTNNQFNGQNGSYYVEFESGLVADIDGTDGAGKRLVLPGSLPSTVTVGSKYRIRKHLTVNDVFGRNNEFGFLEGDSLAAADNVLLVVAQERSTRTFFFSNVPGFTGWYRDDYAPAGDMVIYPEQGIMVRRKSAATQTLYWAGAAKRGVIRVPVFPGFNLVGALLTHRSVALRDLNLITGDAGTGLAAGTSPAEADYLQIVDTNGGARTFFYSNFPGFTGWYDGNFSPADDVTIDPGAAFFINRRAPRELFYWSTPSE